MNSMASMANSEIDEGLAQSWLREKLVVAALLAAVVVASVGLTLTLLYLTDPIQQPVLNWVICSE